MKAFAQTHDLSGDAISVRRAIFLATGVGLTVVGTWLLTGILGEGGFTGLEWALLGLFVVLFGQLAFGFTIGWWGFVALVVGERWEVMRTLEGRGDHGSAGGADGGELASTAVVMPVFNEDTARIFRGIEAMYASVAATGRGRCFDFFVLSDSNQADHWIAEECAWVDLCTRLDAWGRIFYRKRRVSLNGKSGNVADFCRRWGRSYRYVVVLDADSVMDGGTLVRMVRAMEVNPRVGILQTGPRIVRGTSFFQRLVQFTTRSVGPLFAAGSNFWHLGGSNYWGHNAIIRLQPFMEHCVLPELPGRSKSDRHILSHDTVEAALMQQAGWEVWFAYLEPGSYEEGPPNLSDSFKRDRRWCQGNLQHFWFLFAPGTSFTNRIHILFGLLAYLSAPLLVAFIGLSAVDFYWKQRTATFAARSENPLWTDVAGNSAILLTLTVGLLFLPRILGLLWLMARDARGHGGAVRIAIGWVLETGMSILLAPIYLYFYSRFVLLTLLGLRVSWKTQNRSGAEIPIGIAVREYGGATVVGLAVLGAVWLWVPGLVWWLAPVWVGLVLAVPLAVVTSSERLGWWLRRRGLLIIPEEIDAPALLRDLDKPLPALAGGVGVRELVLLPRVNAVHTALLRRSRPRSRHKETYLADLRERLLADGPNGLPPRELNALLGDAEAVAALHRDVWARRGALHADWEGVGEEKLKS